MRRRALLAQRKSGGGAEITFYIYSSPFGPVYELKALDGMTWGDWVDSEYNTIGIFEEPYGDEVIILYPPGLGVTDSGGSWVKGDQIIFAETTYLIG
jgi:hypothetical protein